MTRKEPRTAAADEVNALVAAGWTRKDAALFLGALDLSGFKIVSVEAEASRPPVSGDAVAFWQARCESLQRQLAATPPERSGLDVERLGFSDLLDVATALLDRYPPDTIVCSHLHRADIGARTTAAIADLVESARLSSDGEEDQA